MAIGIVALIAFVFHARRDADEALIDLRLFANRTFAAACGTMILVIIAVFGGMLLMPLYLQSMRGESAMNSGLLLAPQGIGAMLAMPIAGGLADRTGVGQIVPPGLVLIGLTFLGLTQLEADTSYWLFGIDLFFMGIGMGMTMMPTFSGAMQTLRQVAGPEGVDDVEHQPAGRRVDRHGRSVGHPRPRADEQADRGATRPAGPAAVAAASAGRSRRSCWARPPRPTARRSGGRSASSPSRSSWRSRSCRRTGRRRRPTATTPTRPPPRTP